MDNIVVEIIEKLATANLIRTNKVIGDWYSIYCPFHNDGNERKASSGVLLVDQYRNGQEYTAGMFHCFTCGRVYDLVTFVEEVLRSNSISSSALKWLADNVPEYTGMGEYDFDSLVPAEMISKLENSYAIKYMKGVEGTSFVPEEELASYRYTVPYMYERKLTDDIIRKYDVGVDLNWIPSGRKKPVPCITFPVRDKSGNTLFLCRRSIKGKLYNYPSGVTKPLYGIDNIDPSCTDLIVCESCINALTAKVYGYDAVALMGTGNAYQIKQLKELGIHNITLCMDGDETGRRAAKKLQNQLKSVALVWIIDMPEGKDLNDCSKEEFDMLYSNKE